MTFVTKLSATADPEIGISGQDKCDCRQAGPRTPGSTYYTFFPNGCDVWMGHEFPMPFCPPGNKITASWKAFDSSIYGPGISSITSCTTFTSCTSNVSTAISPSSQPSWSPPAAPALPSSPVLPAPPSSRFPLPMMEIPSLTMHQLAIATHLIVIILGIWAFCTCAAAWYAVHLLRSTRSNVHARYTRQQELQGTSTLHTSSANEQGLGPLQL